MELALQYGQASVQAKRNQRITKTEKARHGVAERETQLSAHNSKTVDIQKFKAYIRAKNELNAELRTFYEMEVFRKMKWRQSVYGRKSEDAFINRMRETYGGDALIAYGDWSRTTQMRHFVPTKGVGLRRLISKHFKTVSVNEFRTSKLCCGCTKELSHLRVKREEKTDEAQTTNTKTQKVFAPKANNAYSSHGI